MTVAGRRLVEVRGLAKHFPIARGVIQDGTVKAVDDVSFDVFAGETLGIVGETGCGKTTTARLIVRLLEPTSGEIRFEGEDITNRKGPALKALRRDMQMIFHDPHTSLNPRKTIGQAIAEPYAIHGLEHTEGARKQRVQKLMDTVALNPDHYDRYPHELSGGDRQLASLARALALGPKLLVADDSVSALDVSIQAEILNLLRRLQADLGLTVIFTTRDLPVAHYMCDRVAVMYLGKIVELAPGDALYGFPRHPYTGALLSAVPVPDSAWARPKRELLSGDVPSAANPPSGCRFHPRCQKAQPVCSAQEPALVDKGDGTVAACHYPLSSSSSSSM